MHDYSEFSNDELCGMFSDFYKEVNGFRPRFLCLDEKSQNFNRDSVISEMNSLHEELKQRVMTESGRLAHRAEGWYTPYCYGDRIEFNEIAYRVSFVEMKDEETAIHYELTPIARVDISKIIVSEKSLLADEQFAQDKAKAEYFGMSVEQYRRGY